MDNEFIPIYRIAKVIDNIDPDKFGKIKVRVMPEMNGIQDSFLPWIIPYQNNGGGSENNSSHKIPELDEMIKVIIIDPFWKRIEYLYGDYIENYYPYKNFEAIISNMEELGGQTYPQPNYIKEFKDGSFFFINTKTGEKGIYHNTGDYVLFDADGQIVLHSNKKILLDSSTDGTIDIKSGNKITINGDSAGEILIKTSSGSVKINITSSGVTINGPSVTIGSSSVPPAGFCGLPICLFTGINHTTNTMVAT